MSDTHKRSEVQEVTVKYGKTPLHALAKTILNKLAHYKRFNPVAAQVRVLKENREKIYYISRCDNQGDDLVSYNAPLGRLAALPLGKHIIELPADQRGRSFKDVTFEILEKAIINPEETTLGWDSQPTIVLNDRFGSPLTIKSLQVLLREAVQEGDSIIPASDETKTTSEQDSSNKTQSSSPQKREDTVVFDALHNLSDKIFSTKPTEKISVEKRLPEESVSAIEDLSQNLPPFLLPDTTSTNVFEGLRRNVITKMELRDQPILDQYQDEIFRLPLGGSLLIAGPPGTGKTTTLIRRLGQKIYTEFLKVEEQEIIENIGTKQDRPHQKNWLMFTPTELLKQYLKEAFARENVPASDMQIHTWENFKHELARENFGILKTARNKNGFLLNDEYRTLRPDTQERLTFWHDDFETWHRKHFSEQLSSATGRFISSIDFPAVIEENQRMLSAVDSNLKNFFTLTAKKREENYKHKEVLEDRQKALVTLQRLLNNLAARDYKMSFVQIVTSLNQIKPLVTKINKAKKIIQLPPFFETPVKNYLESIPKYYQAFRNIRRKESLWYQSGGFEDHHLHPLELDVVLLVFLRTIYRLVEEAGYRIDNAEWSSLKPYLNIFRNQIFVDEATDFSPVQLACMECLSHPMLKSFFACGDFNQRITGWGTRSVEQLRWASSGIAIRNINIAYRQSKQLNSLAGDIIRAANGVEQQVNLPAHVNNDGVMPVLLEHATGDTVISWLVDRICEIECFVEQFPSTAVFVNSESEVAPTAASLKKALAEYSINVTACHAGQAVGQDSNVRVFDIQHIKGLEFEAVFFTNVDLLAERHPDLFDKYLYVGATRAATYLGVTCENKLPPVLQGLWKHFSHNWEMKTNE